MSGPFMPSRVVADVGEHATDDKWQARCGCGWSSKVLPEVEADRAAEAHKIRCEGAAKDALVLREVERLVVELCEAHGIDASRLAELIKAGR